MSNTGTTHGYIEDLERKLKAYQDAFNYIDDLMEYRGMTKDEFVVIAARLTKELKDDG
jgi:hypothetical protein